jgi:glucosamine kinase
VPIVRIPMSLFPPSPDADGPGEALIRGYAEPALDETDLFLFRIGSVRDAARARAARRVPRPAGDAPMTTPRLLGLDIGGTCSRALLADAEGRPLARATAPGANPVRVGPEKATELISGLLLDLLLPREGGVDGQEGARVAALCAGMAGVSHPRSEAVLAEALERVARRIPGFAPPVRRLVPDIELAVRAGLKGEDGVLVLSGTGSVAVAARGAARTRRGGLGPLLGDQGSGYGMSHIALRSAALAGQGRRPGTRLYELVAERLGEPAPERWEAALEEHPVASFFPLVLQAAGEGDAVAGLILGSGVDALVDLALETARDGQLMGGLDLKLLIATAGGVLGCEWVLETFWKRLEARHSWIVVRGPHVEEPVLGAISLARDALA